MVNTLKDEVTNDPLGRGYSTMNNSEVAADLNTPYRTRNRTTLTASAVYGAINQAEWGGLTTNQQAEIWNILHMGEVNPFGRAAARFQALFGAGPTLTSLRATRVVAITRAQELGIRARPGLVSEIRRQ